MVTDTAPGISCKTQHRVRDATFGRLMSHFPQPVLGLLVAGRNYVDGIESDKDAPSSTP
jgi:hypothetical protein